MHIERVSDNILERIRAPRCRQASFQGEQMLGAEALHGAPSFLVWIAPAGYLYGPQKYVK